MSWIAAGFVGATALYKGVEGAEQKHQANQIDKSNPYPTETVNPIYQQNLNQAQSMAQTGIPSQSFNNQQNNISQNQAGAIGALSGSANPGANLAGIVRAGDSATNQLNSQDAVARNQAMLNVLQQRSQLAGKQDQAWDWNSQQKYLGLLAKSSALRASGDQNVNSAVNEIGSAGTGVLSGGGFGRSTQTMGQLTGAQYINPDSISGAGVTANSSYMSNSIPQFNQ